MEWKNPDGSVTRGVIIEDGAGNKVTSFSGGGGANASVGTSGAAAPTSATEIGFVNALGNLSALGSANPMPVAVTATLATSDSGAAITGAAMPTGGAGLTGWLSAIWLKLAGTLSVSVSNFPSSQTVTWSGQSVALSGALPAFAATPTVNIGSLPSLPAGASAIGSVSVSNFPATQAVSWSGQSVSLSGTLPAFAATPSFNIASAIPTGANLIGSVNLAIGGGAIGQGNPVATTETYSSLATGQVSVASLATQIVPARAGRKEVTIVNHATTAVYIGGSGITATTGLLLAGVQGEGITITGGAAIYAITASGSETVSFLEVY